jgi:predicted ATPase
MPDLHNQYPDLSPSIPTEAKEARARLFEALCQLILELASGSRPVLLCLDNLHWADDTTLDWLAYLGRQLRGNRLLVIGAYRDEEAETVAVLRRGLARQGVLSEIKIVGLTETAVLQLMQHLGGAGLTQSHVESRVLAGRLQQATGGNPFFLLETLRELVESGRRLEELAGLEDLPLPDTILDRGIHRRDEYDRDVEFGRRRRVGYLDGDQAMRAVG